MVDAGAGILCAGGALLAISGVTKLCRPQSAIQALQSVGAGTTNASASRLLVGVECAIGVGVVIVGGRWLSAVAAATYLGFAAFVVVALRKSSPTCGCTGRADTPPTVSHVIVCLVFASASALTAGLGGWAGVLPLLGDADAIQTVVLLTYVVVVTWLAWMILDLASRVTLSRQH